MTLPTYRRVWVCMQLDKSGYSLTATPVSTPVNAVNCDLLLERWDAGTPHALWSANDVQVNRMAFAVSVLEGEITVWQQAELKRGIPLEWEPITSLHDNTYPHGLAALEGAGAIEDEIKTPSHAYVDPILVKTFLAGEQVPGVPPFRGRIVAGASRAGIVRPHPERAVR